MVEAFFQFPYSNLSKSYFYHIRALNIFVQLLRIMSPRPSYAHWLIAASAVPTSYFLAHWQETSNPNQSHTCRYTTKVESSSSWRHWKNYTGFLSSEHRLQGDNTHVQGSQTGGPSYLSSIINTDAPYHAIHSSADNHRLTVLSFKTKIGSLAFRHSAQSSWNSLPIHIRNGTSVQSFKNRSDILFPAGLQLMTITFICASDSSFSWQYFYNTCCTL